MWNIYLIAERNHGHKHIIDIRDRRPGCPSIEVERADPSRIMTYSEADPEADMLNVIFLPKQVFSIKNATQNA